MFKGKEQKFTIEDAVFHLSMLSDCLTDDDIKVTLNSIIATLKKYEPFLGKTTGFRFNEAITKSIIEYDSTLQSSDISWNWAKELSKKIDDALEPYTPKINAGYEQYQVEITKQKDNEPVKNNSSHPNITDKGYQLRGAIEHILGDPAKSYDYRKINVGDFIEFGTYPQGDNEEELPIVWKVLRKEGEYLFVISKYALDCVVYHTNEYVVSWEESHIRKWLNNYFYHRAFPADDIWRICTSFVTKKTTEHNQQDDWVTKDRIVLISVNEANKYFSSKEQRRCAPTYFAKDKHVETSDICVTSNGEMACWWWLRGTKRRNYIPNVYADGGIDLIGGVANKETYAVRPAMWINLLDEC